MTSGSSSEEDGTQIEVVLHDILQYYTDDLETGSSLTVTIIYSAILTEDAIVGIDPNTNSVYLEHPINPNYEYGGDDIPVPGGGEPTGKTPESKTYVYTTGIKLIKTDESGKVLSGAAFKIEGSGVNVVVTTDNVYVKDEGGSYWKLKDGTYTEEAPKNVGDEGYEEWNDAYESIETKYSLKAQTTATAEGEGEKKSVEAFVDSDGYVTFEGLGAGTYTITETVTPNGYNTIDPITVVITWGGQTQGATQCTWIATATGGVNGTLNLGENGVFEITVENHSGYKLPGTGGIGTTIFYVIGAVLVCGAVVLLLTKRRVNNDQPEA